MSCVLLIAILSGELVHGSVRKAHDRENDLDSSSFDDHADLVGGQHVGVAIGAVGSLSELASETQGILYSVRREDDDSSSFDDQGDLVVGGQHGVSDDGENDVDSSSFDDQGDLVVGVSDDGENDVDSSSFDDQGDLGQHGASVVAIDAVASFSQIASATQEGEAAIYVIGDTLGSMARLVDCLLSTQKFEHAPDGSSFTWGDESLLSQEWRIYILGNILGGPDDTAMLQLVKELSTTPGFENRLQLLLGSHESSILLGNGKALGEAYTRSSFARDLTEKRGQADLRELLQWLVAQNIVVYDARMLLCHGGLSRSVLLRVATKLKSQDLYDIIEALNTESTKDIVENLNGKASGEPFFLSSAGNGFSPSAGVTWFRGYSAEERFTEKPFRTYLNDVDFAKLYERSNLLEPSSRFKSGWQVKMGREITITSRAVNDVRSLLIDDTYDIFLLAPMTWSTFERLKAEKTLNKYILPAYEKDPSSLTALMNLWRTRPNKQYGIKGYGGHEIKIENGRRVKQYFVLYVQRSEQEDYGANTKRSCTEAAKLGVDALVVAQVPGKTTSDGYCADKVPVLCIGGYSPTESPQSEKVETGLKLYWEAAFARYTEGSREFCNVQRAPVPRSEGDERRAPDIPDVSPTDGSGNGVEVESLEACQALCSAQTNCNFISYWEYPNRKPFCRTTEECHVGTQKSGNVEISIYQKGANLKKRRILTTGKWL